MGAISSQITSLTIVFSAIYLDTDHKENIKARRHWLCAGNSPEAGEFPAQIASNAENVSIWWRHHARANVEITENIEKLDNFSEAFGQPETKNPVSPYMFLFDW